MKWVSRDLVVTQHTLLPDLALGIDNFFIQVLGVPSLKVGSLSVLWRIGNLGPIKNHTAVTG